MSFGLIDHYATMVAGCESINNKRPLTIEARYAVSVLKAHAGDMGIYAGNEGFLDSVKRGAASVVEWVKKLARAVIDWIRNTVNKIMGKKIGTTIDINAKGETLAKKIEYLISEMKTIDETKLDSNVKISSLISTAESLVNKLNKKDSGAGKDLDSFNEDLKKNIDVLTKSADKLSKDNEEDNKQAGALGKAIKILSEGLSGIIKIISSATSESAIDPHIFKAVEEKKSPSYIRSALIGELEGNRLTVADWKNTVKYVENKVPNLYEKFELTTSAKELEKDKLKWNDEYYTLASSYLSNNFSKERLYHLAAVYDYLREKGESGYKLNLVVKKSS